MLRLYAIGVLAVSAGMWRFTYGRFAYLIFANHTVLLYTLSIVLLMLIALAMLNCVELTENKKGVKTIKYCSVVYCAVYIVQLGL